MDGAPLGSGGKSKHGTSGRTASTRDLTARPVFALKPARSLCSRRLRSRPGGVRITGGQARSWPVWSVAPVPRLDGTDGAPEPTDPVDVFDTVREKSLATGPPTSEL